MSIAMPQGFDANVWSQLNTNQQALLSAQQTQANQSFAQSQANLQLQKRIQEQQEAISTASNLQKARHDMAKAVIDNMRV
jgi:hypothetical protein